MCAALHAIEMQPSWLLSGLWLQLQWGQMYCNVFAAVLTVLRRDSYWSICRAGSMLTAECLSGTRASAGCYPVACCPCSTSGRHAAPVNCTKGNFTCGGQGVPAHVQGVAGGCSKQASWVDRSQQ
jgi:hypothetical protein